MARARTDHHLPGQTVKPHDGLRTFEPAPLPPRIEWTEGIVAAVGRASAALGRLRGLGAKFPRPQRLVRLFLRREAEASSRIEQTHARVRTMLFFEHLPEAARSNPSVREVENNFRMLEVALAIVRERPLSLADVRALHAALFRDVSNAPRSVGQFRRVQNWIGSSSRVENARYVPPPPASVPHLMRQLIEFVNEGTDGVPLVRTALAHYQFEAIHPFDDGNGRVGRALVLAQLSRERLIDEPLLNPSAGLERNRRAYYDCLLDVSRHGAWEPWIRLFCDAVAEEAEDSIRRLDWLERLLAVYRERLSDAGHGVRLLALVDHLLGDPVMTARQAAEAFGVTPAAGQRMLEKLERLKIVQEATGKTRSRIWVAQEFLAAFERDMTARVGDRTTR